MKRLARFLLRHRLAPSLRALHRSCRDPLGSQIRVLRKLLAQAAGTEWGRRYGFAELARQPDVVAAYRKRVPLHDYEAFREDILRTRRGEPDVLWPGQIRWFATSAGTTARAKNVPVSRELARANLRHSAAALLSYLAETENLDCLGGMPITLTGHVAEDREHPGTWAGEISGVVAEYWYRRSRLLRVVARRRNIPDEIRQTADWDRKLDRIVDYAMDRDVRILGFVPSWGLQLFDRLIEGYRRKHDRSVTTVGEIWPNLKLIISGGVPLRVYAELLRERVGLARLDLVEVYGASEAPIALQSSRSDPAMLLNLDNGVYFEFVRVEDLSGDNPPRCSLGEVEPEVRYLPVVTTCGGLWAYGLGDVIRFTQVSPYKIVVTGRTGEMLDSYGEFVRGEEARDALQYACKQTGSRAFEFHLAPRPAGDGRRHTHQWLIEFEGVPPSVEAFAQAVDARLQEINPMYASCRQEKGFGMPEVVSLPKGTFYRWLKTSRGTIGAQTKVPSMSDNRDLADGVLALVERDERG